MSSRQPEATPRMSSPWCLRCGGLLNPSHPGGLVARPTAAAWWRPLSWCLCCGRLPDSPRRGGLVVVPPWSLGGPAALVAMQRLDSQVFPRTPWCPA
ncbi:hypothetical protein BS78_05G181900 [Paspalum vaginatum]|nr:hypothetical protein BS78_05G181900 [Paspalum vaginatum]